MGFTSSQGTDAPHPDVDIDVYAVEVTEASVATLDTLWFGGDLIAEWRTVDGTVLGDALSPDGLTLDPGTAYLALTTTPTGVITNHLTASLAPAPTARPEDLDLDGIIGTGDILEARPVRLRGRRLPDGCSADVDGDGVVGVRHLGAVLFGLLADQSKKRATSRRPFFTKPLGSGLFTVGSETVQHGQEIENADLTIAIRISFAGGLHGAFEAEVAGAIFNRSLRIVVQRVLISAALTSVFAVSQSSVRCELVEIACRRVIATGHLVLVAHTIAIGVIQALTSTIPAGSSGNTHRVVSESVAYSV